MTTTRSVVPHFDFVVLTDLPQYYAPDYELDVRPSNMDNANSLEYLQKIKVQVIENLKRTTFNPSVQMTDVPRDMEGMNDEADAELDDLDEDENPDTRYTKRGWDKYVEKDGELSESEDEAENEANGVRKQPESKRRRNIMDYQNPAAAADDNEVVSRATSARGGRVNGVNGTRHSSGIKADESEVDASEGPRDGSSPSPAREDEEDVEMADEADEAEEPAVEAPPSADGAQEATPPDSPPAAAADATVPDGVAEDTGNDAMDEGDTLDDPDLAKEEGHDEREMEDVTAEKTTEAAEEAES